MRLQLIFLALSFLFTTSLCTTEDVEHIKKLTADFAISLDTKNYKAFEKQFTPTASYDPGNGPVTGFANIEKVLATIVTNQVTQTSVTTQSILLAPPFDGLGAAGTATGTTYNIVTFIGKGPKLGNALLIYGLWRDKFVKTGDFAYHGGWKFSSRVFVSLVSILRVSTIS